MPANVRCHSDSAGCNATSTDGMAIHPAIWRLKISALLEQWAAITAALGGQMAAILAWLVTTVRLAAAGGCALL